MALKINTEDWQILKKNNVKTGKFSHCKEKVGELKIDQ